ncbi:unnamed protein product [Urochloa humidicola]
MMLNGRGGMLRNAVTPFAMLFNRSAASSSARTPKLFVGGLSYDTNEFSRMLSLGMVMLLQWGDMPSNDGEVQRIWFCFL